MKQIDFKKKLAVFFDGKGCMSNAGKKTKYDTFATDILDDKHIDLAVDIMSFNPEMLGNWIPDVAHFSPPCETFSNITNIKGGGNLYYQTKHFYSKNGKKVKSIFPRTDFTCQDKLIGKGEKYSKKQKEHAAFVDKTIEIIKYFQSINPNFVWTIENPASGYMRFYLQGKLDNIIENRTTYCMYGSSYRKETSIFSNIKLDLKFCRKHSKKRVDDCGGHSDNFHQRSDHRKQSKGVVLNLSYLERSTIPELLCLDILEQIKERITIPNKSVVTVTQSKIV